MMDREFLIGVELTPRTITAGLVDLSGKIVKKISVPTELSKGKKRVIDNIASAVNKVKKNQILGVGVSVPGIINREKGIVIDSILPGWNGLFMKKMLEDVLHVPVFVENEGKCFALAEYKCGAFRKTENTIGVLFNEGISTGLIIDGKLAKGCSYAAGCISHSIVDSKKGRLEDYASPASIEKLFKQRTRKSKPISEIVISNDKAAKDVLKIAGTHFGNTMSYLVNALNPEIIIVGGPLAKSEYFISAAETALTNKSNDICGKKVKIIPSKLNDSAILGAASIVI
ncbi:ROK family protein [Candidatus Woesearchaeota archaeon]|nr:ROK family protein [Candidatus Woesearchaeota archaeon]